jgi:hypothetical protein
MRLTIFWLLASALLPSTVAGESGALSTSGIGKPQSQSGVPHLMAKPGEVFVEASQLAEISSPIAPNRR